MKLPADHPANKDKSCMDCGEIKPPSEFPRHKHPRGFKGILVMPRCHSCHREYKNKAHIKRVYGLTEVQYQELMSEQGNKCSICGSSGSGKNNNRFVVDHCHTTGKVRGLLCWPCNIGIGMFKDNTELLQKVVAYLSK